MMMMSRLLFVLALAVPLEAIKVPGENIWEAVGKSVQRAFTNMGTEHDDHDHSDDDPVPAMPYEEPYGCAKVIMTKQESEKYDCIEGISYGCLGPRKMWVDNGCRGNFLCNGGKEDCESWDKEYETCTCDAPEEDLSKDSGAKLPKKTKK